jgi:hypothetical protein
MNLRRILLIQTILIGLLILLVARLYWKLADEKDPEPSAQKILIPPRLDSIPNLVHLSDSLSIKQEPIQTPKPRPEIDPRPGVDKPIISTPVIQHQEEKKYYSNGKLSLWISPWKEGRRYWKLYDLYGNETIELEEVHLSYSVSYDARFHENGAVKIIHFSENPGAANFWYEGEMEFSTTNEPITRRVRRMPVESLEEMVHRKWVYWDKRTKSWREQETSE